MVYGGQTGNKTLLKMRFLPLLCIFNNKFCFVVDWESWSFSVTTAMGRRELKPRLFSALQDKHREISITHSGGWQVFPLVQ